MGVVDPSDAQALTLRVRIDISYEGTDFHGWAAQPGLRTVEGELERALAVIMRCPVALTVAGRTDAGVHARHQVAHADIPIDTWRALTPRNADPFDEDAPGRGLARRLNALLAQRRAKWAKAHALKEPHDGSDVVVTRTRRVPTTFDARFSATGRRYCYRLAEWPLDPVRRRDVLAVRDELDLDAMNAGAGLLIGEHDFLSFCRPREGATTIRTLRRYECVRRGGIIECWVEADAFCHSMVRSLVGAAIEVGRGKHEPMWMGEVLKARSRAQAAPIAPAHGLSLEGVDYPPVEQWAARQRVTRARRDECCGD